MAGFEFDFAEGWRPEKKGDAVKGRVTSLDTGYSQWQPNGYPIVTIEQENGESVAVHCFHTALSRRLAEVEPAIGDRLGIRYDGKVNTKDGKMSYHSYSVSAPDRKFSNFWESHDGGQTAPPRPDASDFGPTDAGSSSPVPVPDDDDVPF